MAIAPALMDVPLPARALRILVVDDDADMRLYLAGCLRSLGLTDAATVAADGEEALHLARSHAFDLIISDLAMPGLDGLALCHALKAEAATASIPFLLVSGETRAPPPCADGFLAKPFNAARLCAHVERLLPPS